MIRKPNRPSLASDAALLLSQGVALLGCHGHSNGGGRFLRPGCGGGPFPPPLTVEGVVRAAKRIGSVIRETRARLRTSSLEAFEQPG